MLSSCIRTIVPTALNFCKATAFHRGLQPNIFLRFPSALTNRSVSFNLRCYSQEVNAENLAVVDFDYVKKVTLQNEVMIIDVREPDEIKEHGKIPNSINIPLGSVSTSLAMSEKEFIQSFNRSKPKENTELVFYCMIGKRSGKAQQSALSLGFKNAKNYLGSWTDWAIKSQ